MTILQQPFLRRTGLLLAVLAAYWALVIYQLGAQWSAFEQYNYGWAVPFLCLFLLWERVKNEDGKLKLEAGRRSAGGGYLLSSIFYLLAVSWAVTRWLHEANPVWRMTSWALALEVVGLTLLAMRLVLGASSFQFSNLVFPVCFFLVAVPWPGPVEARLTDTLTQGNVAVTTELLNFLGIPALQKGNVIEVATGLVGVDEACSGIRSFQSTLMIALFFGELYRLSVGRRLLSVLAGFGFAFLFNIGRTSLLVSVAARDGVPAMHKWHDPAGVIILVGCFTSVWLFCGRMRNKKSEVRSQKSEVGGRRLEGEKFETGNLPFRLAVGLGIWFVLTEAGIEWWYRTHEARSAAAQSWSVRWPTTQPQFRWVTLSDAVKRQLACDSGAQCSWGATEEAYWQLVYFRWLPSRSIYARVRSQLNKTHRPEHCLIASGMKLVRNLGVGSYEVGGQKFALHRFVFEADGRLLRVYYGQYEDSAPPDSVASYRADTSARVGAALSGSRNYGLRIFELAVAGIADDESAEAAVRRQLAAVISLEPGVAAPGK